MVENESIVEDIAPKKSRPAPLISLFVANMISYAGNILTSLAIPWFVLVTTGSVIQTGITVFFTTVPTVLSSFLGGVMVDRLGYKRASVVSDLITGVCVALIPLLSYTIGLAFWQLLVLVFLASFFKMPGETARTSILPDLVEMTDMPLMRANSISQGIAHIATLVGAPLAGILIALIGPRNLLWVDASSFVVSALIIGLIVPRKVVQPKAVEEHPQEEVAQPQAKLNYLAEIKAGLSFIVHDPALLAILITLIVTNMLDIAFSGVGIPVYVRQFFGTPAVLGLISAITVGFALLGTMIFGAIGHGLPRRLLLILSLTITGLRFLVFALFPSLTWVLLISAIAGIASAPLNPIIYTIAYERVPNEMRARVFGVGIGISILGAPLGILIFSYLVSGVGISTGLLVMGICYLLTMVGMVANPGLRAVEKKEAIAAD